MGTDVISTEQQKQTEQRLAGRLVGQFARQAPDRSALTKRLLLSGAQLDALLAGDPSAFHTYGIYLRALEQLMGLIGLLDDPEAMQDLQTLQAGYDQSPRGTHIRKVRETINQSLGVAPSEQAAVSSKKAALALLITVLVLVLGAVAFAWLP